MHSFSILLALALAATGCGQDDAGSTGGAGDPGGPVGLSPAGAQDFGLFRQVLEDGEIPAPEVLDDLGFFAEHKLEFPDPDCGQDVCIHGLLGVMGNLMTGANCTLITLGLNTPIDPNDLERPPLNLVLAIDVSGSMEGDPIDFVRQGLRQMLKSLEPADRVSLVTYSDSADIVFEALTGEDTKAMDSAISALLADGSTNLFDGLYTAYQLADLHREAERQNRVILLSDGVATAGIESDAKAVALAQAWARQGVALTTIGVGTDFDVELMRDLSESGAGSFYFLEDPKSAVEVFTDEVKAFMVPVALDVQIRFSVGAGYEVREAFGTNGWSPGTTGGSIDIPALFLAGRTDDTAPATEGRRGGGGAILIEAMPTATIPAGEEAFRVGTIELSWVHPVTGEVTELTSDGEVMEQTADIINPNPPGQWPLEGTFSDKTAEKAFVMLNLYVAFRMASELATDGDLPSAMGVLQAVRPNVQAWLGEHPDSDIEDDLGYVDLFIANLQAKGATIESIPGLPEPWPFD
jgi:Ca-activated chloride channel family protein